MLFNSYAFVVFFLPITLLVFAALSRRGRATSALVSLLAASLFFYGWWNPRYLVLLLASILWNHAIGEALLRSGPQRRRAWLAFGIAVDLLGIGWFKYAGFLATNAAWLLGPSLRIPDVVLPLAISFFTFTQIAYLVDVHRGTAPHYDLLRYALFVTFFPHLIAGPIVRHGELIPQFDERRRPSRPGEDLTVGASIFAVGLFKKVVIADSLAGFATPVFAAAGKGTALGALEAWGGALAYTFQLYFDFSGYCDMAIGASLLFGMRLPANFDSPYKATSLTDFWRR